MTALEKLIRTASNDHRMTYRALAGEALRELDGLRRRMTFARSALGAIKLLDGPGLDLSPGGKCWETAVIALKEMDLDLDVREGVRTKDEAALMACPPTNSVDK